MLTIDDMINNPGDSEARREWAASLKEQDMRSLANDFREGDSDPAALDAWVELGRRIQLGRVKGIKRCEQHTGRRGRFPMNCLECRLLAQLAMPAEMSLLATS